MASETSPKSIRSQRSISALGLGFLLVGMGTFIPIYLVSEGWSFKGFVGLLASPLFIVMGLNSLSWRVVVTPEEIMETALFRGGKKLSWERVTHVVSSYKTIRSIKQPYIRVFDSHNASNSIEISLTNIVNAEELVQHIRFHSREKNPKVIQEFRSLKSNFKRYRNL